MRTLSELLFILAAILFIIGLKMLSSPVSARKGNGVSALAMLLAIIATLIHQDIVDFRWLTLGLVIGSLIGIIMARRVAMTGMPEMVALLNGLGGIASLLVGWAEFDSNRSQPWGSLVPTSLAILIGGLTFTGSLMAYGKLSEKLSGKPVQFGGQRVINALLLALAVLACVLFSLELPGDSAIMNAKYPIMIAIVLISLALGVLAVLPIGGADMPVVISLLNSYSGVAACAAGFVVLNNVLIVAGALVGASGLILTGIMCRAMNRSLSHVLFSGFGAAVKQKAGPQGTVSPISADDCYLVLEAASSVVVVPGYGMAVAQAQHVVRELGELLAKNDTEVRYAIHPVAGRMPGHMNVLLAEASVPYEQLVEPGDVNPAMESVDVCLIIGANDVVNPAARDDQSSPIYGMPIIEVDRARTVIVCKRSMASGFAGIENPLFFKNNTRMLFGDAKDSIGALVSAFKAAAHG